jgi:hypothetical protein
VGVQGVAVFFDVGDLAKGVDRKEDWGTYAQQIAIQGLAKVGVSPTLTDDSPGAASPGSGAHSTGQPAGGGGNGGIFGRKILL